LLLGCDIDPRFALCQQDIYLLVETCSAINEHKGVWGSLLLSAGESQGVYSCYGIDSPVTVFAPKNVSTYQADFFPGNSTSAVSWANECTPITGTQAYFGMLFFGHEAEPTSADGIIRYNEELIYGLLIAAWCAYTVMSLCGAGGASFRGLVYNLYLGAAVESCGQMLGKWLFTRRVAKYLHCAPPTVNLYLVSMHADAFVNIAMPANWLLAHFVVVAVIIVVVCLAQLPCVGESFAALAPCISPCSWLFGVICLQIPTWGFAIYNFQFYSSINSPALEYASYLDDVVDPDNAPFHKNAVDLAFLAKDLLAIGKIDCWLMMAKPIHAIWRYCIKENKNEEDNPVAKVLDLVLNPASANI
jgi:hypothetical protein